MTLTNLLYFILELFLMNSIILHTHDDQTLQSVNAFKNFYRKPKKYQLNKVLTQRQKNFEMKVLENDMKTKKKKIQTEYFTNILKIQKQNMFKNTFLRKLKSAIVSSNPPLHQILTDQYFEIDQDQQGLQMPKYLQMTIELLTLIQSTFLLILISFTFIFETIANEQFTFYYTIFSLFIQIGIIIKKFVHHTTFQENKLRKSKEIVTHYLQNQFSTDSVILVSLIITLAINFSGVLSVISRLLLFLKLKQIYFGINYFEITLIKNVYKEQIWSLIKVFISNFLFAHIIAIILIFMTQFNRQNNWLVKKQLAGSQWSQIYVWSYYWAATVMLTVGFGDITPTTTQEATFMIFVQMMSCVILAYNFNCVGTILTKIRSYEVEKNSNLKTFNYMKESSEMSNETENKIMNYIKQSTQMKRNFNIEQEKQFLQKLPPSFKNDLLKEKNRGLWDNMMFFRNLSEQTLLTLSVLIEKKLAHPDQVIYKKGTQIDIIIFNKGGFGYSYNNGNSPKNGSIIQKFKVQKNQYKIISLDFLLDKTLNYDISCTDYSMVYKMSRQKFLSVLKENNYDFEYYSMIKDKDKFLLNQFQLEACQICPKQRHSLFKCTKLHYIPISQHIIHKKKDIFSKKLVDFSKAHRKIIRHFKTLRQLKNLKRFVVFSRYKEGSNKTLIGTQLNFDLKSSQQYDLIESLSLKHIDSQKNTLNNHATKFYEQAVNEIKSKLDNFISPVKFSWQLELDVSHNFKFYFRKDNAEEITSQMNKKLSKTKKKNDYPFKTYKS